MCPQEQGSPVGSGSHKTGDQASPGVCWNPPQVRDVMWKTPWEVALLPVAAGGPCRLPRGWGGMAGPGCCGVWRNLKTSRSALGEGTGGFVSLLVVELPKKEFSRQKLLF